MRAFRLFCVTCLFCAATIAAHATAFTYTETIQGTGLFDSAAFTNQTVTLVGYGNTANITSPFSGTYNLNLTSLTVQIGSGPIVALTDSFQVFDNQSGNVAGITDLSIHDDLLDASGNAFGNYALKTAATGTGTTTVHAGIFYNEADGKLFGFTATTGRVTLTAAPEAITATTPEPSSLVLLGTGLIGALGATRRKFLKTFKA